MGDGDPVLNEDEGWRQVHAALTSGILLAPKATATEAMTRPPGGRYVTADGARVTVYYEHDAIDGWSVELWNQIGIWHTEAPFHCTSMERS